MIIIKGLIKNLPGVGGEAIRRIEVRYKQFYY